MFIKNKKAYHNYTMLEKYSAGIILVGSEVKSLKENGVSFGDAYCMFVEHELFLKNLYIAEYKNANILNHDPVHDRKLLLNKRELVKLNKKVKATGLTIVPTVIYINEKGLIKVEVCLAKGKKEYDKRQTIKTREYERS
jgi:SsrA-binding protein